MTAPPSRNSPGRPDLTRRPDCRDDIEVNCDPPHSSALVAWRGDGAYAAGVGSYIGIAEARDRVGRWIARCPFQRADGAIAGVLDVAGAPLYLYGEIAGYWLRWSALYAPDPVRMSCAIAWLTRQWSGPGPGATRLGAMDDWRNRAVFSFDVAMILRGLADVAPLLGEARLEGLARRLSAWLEVMVNPEGRLDACRGVGSEALPDRWSTREGPFQTKTAAAVLDTPASWTSPRVHAAARRTLAHWKGRAGEQRDWHPRLYALEGDPGPEGKGDIAGLVAGSPAVGIFTEAVDDSTSVRRADVQAQALRLLTLGPGASPSIVRRVAAGLLPHIRKDGSIGFSLDDSGSNVWCALFAHQALDWACTLVGQPGRTPDRHDII